MLFTKNIINTVTLKCLWEPVYEKPEAVSEIPGFLVATKWRYQIWKALHGEIKTATALTGWVEGVRRQEESAREN